MGQGRDGNVKICGYRAESVSRSGRGDYFTFRNGFGWCGSSSAETHHKTLAAAGVELHAETRGFSAESAVIRFEFLLRLLRLLRLHPILPELVQPLVECFQTMRKCIINRTPCQVVAERCETVGPYRVEPRWVCIFINMNLTISSCYQRIVACPKNGKTFFWKTRLPVWGTVASSNRAFSC